MAVSLHPGVSPCRAVREADARAQGVVGFGTDPDATLEWCRAVAPLVAAGTAPRDAQWELLASTAARDVAAARILEPHLDALNILAEAGIDPADISPSDATWGVFAAEGPGMRLEAREDSGIWRLSGTKPWCSLAARLSHALVTAHVPGGRRLFAVALRSRGVKPHDGPWTARGLPGVVSAPVDFTDVAAVAVGDTGWYLDRPGFALGGIGVAACWWGGAAGLLPALRAAATRENADQIAHLHLGRADAVLWAARAALSEAAAIGDDATPALAARVRWIVADAAETVLREADHALGPLPLVADDAHARRVADLHLYLRQHHGERDVAKLGRDLAGARS